ncbi:MAG: NifB/NifX family molybdenum-iron cluster-binding protein [Candidatus Methanomethylophilaceae archaeon]|nr:NifB/NifX family molybdenum-iron cluster-binding protein [Candidatus Methanomethylophilaceae archaeon]
MNTIAVTYENGEVFQHFGRTQQFKVYQIEDGKVVSSEVIDNGGFGHGSLAGYLRSKGVTALICGGIGAGARNMLGSEGITVYPGASGDVDKNVDAFIEGRLQYDPATSCHEHDHDCHCH